MRTGRRLLTLALLVLTSTLIVGRPARAHGEEFDVVVEAVGLDPGDPRALAYGIVLTFADDDAVTGAGVAVSADLGNDRVLVPAGETTAGVYTAELELPTAGDWTITIQIEAAETSGSVSFVEKVGATWIDAPIVRVDTENPDRQNTAVGADSAVFGGSTGGATTTSSEEVRVEALVRDAVAPLSIDYGVEAPAAQTAAISATSGQGDSIGPAPLDRRGDGRFVGRIEYSSSGTWAVTLLLDDEAAAEFGENLPWPHYSTEAGFPKVKIDTSDPALEGTLTTIEDSAIFGATEAPDPVTTTTTPAGTTPSPGTTQPQAAPPVTDDAAVSIQLPSNTFELRRQVLLRWSHLLSILAWVVGAIGLGRGGSGRWWLVMTVTGSVATVGTGLGLAAWGAPTAFPGLLRWSELGERLYGSAYQVAFQVKMTMVLIGLIGTGLLIARRSYRRLGIVLGGLAGAAAALVAMSQFHLWAHL